MPSPLKHRAAMPPAAPAAEESGRAADLSTAARLLDLAIPLVRRHAGGRCRSIGSADAVAPGFLGQVAAARDALARHGHPSRETPQQLFEAACFVGSQSMAGRGADAAGLRDTLAELAALAWVWHDALAEDGEGGGR